MCIEENEKKNPPTSRKKILLNNVRRQRCPRGNWDLPSPSRRKEKKIKGAELSILAGGPSQSKDGDGGKKG